MVSPDQKLLREHIFQLQNSNPHLEVFHRTLKMLRRRGGGRARRAPHPGSIARTARCVVSADVTADASKSHGGPFPALARRRKESTVAKRRAHPRSGAPRGVANPRTAIARRSGAGLGWFHVHPRRPEKRANQTVDSWVILRNAFDRSLIGRFRARTLWWTVRESSAAGVRDSFEGETRKKE